MVFIRNSEQRLLDTFRSLTASGQAHIATYAQQEAFRNHSDAVSSSYGDLSEADNIMAMNKAEQRFIANFRRCNETGCSNIEAELNSVRKKYLNPDYITSEEWLLLDLFRNCSVENRFKLIQSLMNQADSSHMDYHV